MKFLIGLLLVTLSLFANAGEKEINEYTSNIRSYSIESYKLNSLLNNIPNCLIKSVMNTNQTDQYSVRTNTTIIYINSDECVNDFNKLLQQKERVEVLEKISQDQKLHYTLGFLFGMIILVIIYLIRSKYLKNKKGNVNESST